MYTKDGKNLFHPYFFLRQNLQRSCPLILRTRFHFLQFNIVVSLGQAPREHSTRRRPFQCRLFRAQFATFADFSLSEAPLDCFRARHEEENYIAAATSCQELSLSLSAWPFFLHAVPSFLFCYWSGGCGLHSFAALSARRTLCILLIEVFPKGKEEEESLLGPAFCLFPPTGRTAVRPAGRPAGYSSLFVRGSSSKRVSLLPPVERGWPGVCSGHQSRGKSKQGKKRSGFFSIEGGGRGAPPYRVDPQSA